MQAPQRDVPFQHRCEEAAAYSTEALRRLLLKIALRVLVPAHDRRCTVSCDCNMDGLRPLTIQAARVTTSTKLCPDGQYRACRRSCGNRAAGRGSSSSRGHRFAEAWEYGLSHRWPS